MNEMRANPFAVASYPLLARFRFAKGPPSREEQLFRFLHSAIAGGSLAAGSRLPASRLLARELGTARQTVVAVFERLQAEGLLTARRGDGTYVADIAAAIAARPQRPAAPRVSRRAQAVDAAGSAAPGVIRPLEPGVPDLSDFPFGVWARLSGRFWRSSKPQDLTYSDGAGVPQLRQAISGFVSAFRGVPCHPDQVVITAGTQSGIMTAALLLTDPGDLALVESPGYRTAHHALRLAGLQLAPLPVDWQGARPESADPADLARARLLLCAPAHHYPLGATTTLQRRQELLAWAEAQDAAIIEDDYDSEFRYAGPPLPGLAQLDQGRGRVIYAGTLSKLLAPGLRVGFLVLPDPLIEPARGVRLAIDRHLSTPLQQVTAAFIANGHLAAHIRRMIPLYAERRAALVAALEHHLGSIARVRGAETGLTLCAELPDAAMEAKAAALAEALGLGCKPLSRFVLEGQRPQHRGLVMGFATSPPEVLEQAVADLARGLGTRADAISGS